MKGPVVHKSGDNVKSVFYIKCGDFLKYIIELEKHLLELKNANIEISIKAYPCYLRSA